MIVYVWTRNDETGVFDGEFRDGDIDHMILDSQEASIGQMEKKQWLLIKILDPPDPERAQGAVRESIWTEGEDGVSVVKDKRKYRIDWRTKFSASEVAIVEDQNAMLPDGTTSGGGTVTSGVVSGLFTFADFVRK